MWSRLFFEAVSMKISLLWFFQGFPSFSVFSSIVKTEKTHFCHLLPVFFYFSLFQFSCTQCKPKWLFSLSCSSLIAAMPFHDRSEKILDKTSAPQTERSCFRRNTKRWSTGKIHFSQRPRFSTTTKTKLFTSSVFSIDC